MATDGTKQTRTTLDREVRRADPDFDRDRKKETEYKFSNGRRFTADPSTRGAYAPEEG